MVLRDNYVYNIRKALPRMSWHPQNLYNLMRRSTGERAAEIKLSRTDDPMFRQRWLAKKLVRAYHGDFIAEKAFKRWYLPELIPDVRPKQRLDSKQKESVSSSSAASVTRTPQEDELARFARRKEESMYSKALEDYAKDEAQNGVAPVGSLMFSEVERRIDVFIFRCCFAQSVYEARRLVIHGRVKLNGRKITNSNTRLAPGDMVSVDPRAIRFLQTPESGKERRRPIKEAEEKSAPVEAEAEAEEGEQALTPFQLPEFAYPHIFIPAYIEVSFNTCSAIYVRHPTARPGYSEIPTPYEADGEIVRLAWEWYSKARPRMRSKAQLARAPPTRNVPETNRIW